MTKLKPEHIAPHLPWGLKWGYIDTYYPHVDGYYSLDKKDFIARFTCPTEIGSIEYPAIANGMLPICRPWSDLTKTIKQDGKEFVPLLTIASQTTDEQLLRFLERGFIVNCDPLPYFVVKQLIQWHFPVGIPEWIDVNTLNEEIY